MSGFQVRSRRMIGDANFYIEKGKAYTEDNVLVYNLFIYGVPQCITKAQMAAFFGKFGEILQIRLTCNENEGEPTQSGFVNFKDAKSAAKVLQLKEHKIQKKSFGVKACVTWHQPPPLELFPPEMASPLGVYKKRRRVNVDPGPAAIDGVKLVDLNDDCLDHILKFLSTRDQLNFGRVSQSFRGILEMFYKTQYRVVDCENLCCLTTWEVREFLILTGPHVEVLMGSSNLVLTERTLEFIIKYVRDLKSLTLHYLKNNHTYSLCKMLRKFVSLKELCLVQCEVDDLTLHTISRLPNLESLQLGCRTRMAGGKNRGLLHRDHFNAMFAALTQLRSLEISWWYNIDEGLLTKIVHHCTKLETVKISVCGFPVDVVATLPSLKRLEINALKHEYLEPLCHALGAHRATQLEELLINTYHLPRLPISKAATQSIGRLKKLRLLKLNNFDVDSEALSDFHKLESLRHIELWYCRLLTDVAVLRLLGSCKNLRHVKIVYCDTLSNNFIESANEMLRSQGRKVKKEQESDNPYMPGRHYVFSIKDS